MYRKNNNRYGEGHNTQSHYRKYTLTRSCFSNNFYQKSEANINIQRLPDCYLNTKQYFSKSRLFLHY